MRINEKFTQIPFILSHFSLHKWPSSTLSLIEIYCTTSAEKVTFYYLARRLKALTVIWAKIRLVGGYLANTNVLYKSSQYGLIWPFCVLFESPEIQNLVIFSYSQEREGWQKLTPAEQANKYIFLSLLSQLVKLSACWPLSPKLCVQVVLFATWPLSGCQYWVLK